MLITKEQQEALISNYCKKYHNSYRVCGFIDGIIAIMDLIDRLDKNEKESKLTNSNHGE